MKAEIVMVQEWPELNVMRIRFDLIPDKEDKEYYKQHHVFVPDIPPDAVPPTDENEFQTWIDSFPKKERTNPCLCQFIIVPLSCPQQKIREVMEWHKDRVKAAPIDHKTGERNVKDKSVSDGIRNHLRELGIDRSKAKPRGQKVLVEGKLVDSSILPNHKLLGLKV